MKNNQFSEEKLKQIRKMLPRGGQKKITEILNSQGNTLTIFDINRVLHGSSLSLGKPPVEVIIKVALSLCYDENKEQGVSESTVANYFDTTVKQ